MEKIKIPKISLQLTVEEVQYLNDLIDRDTTKDGILTDKGGNECPNCHWTLGFLGKDAFSVGYCPNCGQLVRYNDSDVIPFEAD